MPCIHLMCLFFFPNSITNNSCLNAVDENDALERKLLMMWEQQERIFGVMLVRRQAGLTLRAPGGRLALTTLLSEKTVPLDAQAMREVKEQNAIQWKIHAQLLPRHLGLGKRRFNQPSVSHLGWRICPRERESPVSSRSCGIPG